MRLVRSAFGAVLALSTSSFAQLNILVLMADDLGPDGVGAYGVGPSPPSTPVIDSLAASGVLFRNAWAHPLCTPTRATIQTGLFPFRTGLGAKSVDGETGLSLSHVILPEALDLVGSGHSHAYFGKWHLANDTVGGPLGPNLAGYSHFAGVAGNLGIDPDVAYFEWEKIVDGSVFTQTGYVTSDTVDDALAWIQQAAEPWFAFVAFNAPHAPVHAPPSHLHGVDLSTAGPPKQDPVPYFKAVVEALDTEIGRLLQGVGPSLADTCVIFLGDNGSAFLPNGKGTAYENGVRVPFVVSGPPVQAGGREETALACVSDIYDTLVELAGGQVVPGVLDGKDSVSLLPHLTKPGTPPRRRFAWAETFKPNAPATPAVLRRAIRDERYKLMLNVGIFDPPLPPGLFFFDLVNDPNEMTNLLGGALTVDEQRAFGILAGSAVKLLNS
jgi:arylsulfatase A-like enzyme